MSVMGIKIEEGGVETSSNNLICLIRDKKNLYPTNVATIRVLVEFRMESLVDFF